MSTSVSTSSSSDLAPASELYRALTVGADSEVERQLARLSATSSGRELIAGHALDILVSYLIRRARPSAEATSRLRELLLESADHLTSDPLEERLLGTLLVEILGFPPAAIEYSEVTAANCPKTAFSLSRAAVVAPGMLPEVVSLSAQGACEALIRGQPALAARWLCSFIGSRTAHPSVSSVLETGQMRRWLGECQRAGDNPLLAWELTVLDEVASGQHAKSTD